MDATRALLDQLMGPNRNRVQGDNAPEARWDDEKTCPWHLCGFCPHGLFKNTKEDLGSCTLLHSPMLKEEFKKQPESVQRKYKMKYLRFLESLLARGESRILRAKDRLEAKTPYSDPTSIRQRKQIAELETKISVLDREIETLGEQGKVREAEEQLKKMENLNKQLAHLQEALVQHVKREENNQEEETLTVCDVCGGLIKSEGDSKRYTAHQNGRLHTGYLKIREEVKELRKWAEVNDFDKVGRDASEERERRRRRERSRSRNRSRRERSRRGGSRDRERRRRDRSRRTY